MVGVKRTAYFSASRFSVSFSPSKSVTSRAPMRLICRISNRALMKAAISGSAKFTRCMSLQYGQPLSSNTIAKRLPLAAASSRSAASSRRLSRNQGCRRRPSSVSTASASRRRRRKPSRRREAAIGATASGSPGDERHTSMLLVRPNNRPGPARRPASCPAHRDMPVSTGFAARSLRDEVEPDALSDGRLRRGYGCRDAPRACPGGERVP